MNLSPLSNFTIVEIAGSEAAEMHHLALGLAGKMVADLGAHVIRIVPEAGDPLDGMRVRPWEMAGRRNATKAFLTSSKENLVQMLENAEQIRAILNEAHAILTFGNAIKQPTSDCLMVRLATLPERHPMGTGDNPSIGEIGILALSGLLDVVGSPDREPLALGGHQIAYAAGLSCFSALMAGLFGLCGDGSAFAGDTYDVNMLDTANWVNWKVAAAEAFSTKGPPTREGESAEWRVMEAGDGWFAFVVSERDWPQLVDMIGGSSTVSLAESDRPAIIDAVEAWAKHLTREEIYRSAQSRRIPFAPVIEPGEMLDDPHCNARGMFSEIESLTGLFTFPKIPVIWNGQSFPVERPVRRGKHDG